VDHSRKSQGKEGSRGGRASETGGRGGSTSEGGWAGSPDGREHGAPLDAEGGDEVGGKRGWTEEVQLLHRNVQRFRGGLVFKAHRIFVSLNSRLESNKEEKTKYERGRERGRERWIERGRGIDLAPPSQERCKVFAGVQAVGSLSLSIISNPTYRGTSLIRNRLPLGPYSRQMPRALRWP